MTEEYIVLSVVAAALVVGIAALLTGIRHKLPKKKKVPKQSTQKAQPQQTTDLNSLTGILKQSIGLEEHIYENRYVPTASGEIACIPAMYLGPKGMMLFSYQPLEGWVLGDKDSRWWTFFVSSDERNYINNPIWECRQLIGDLKKFLPATDDSDYRIDVIFSDQCEIRSVETAEGIYVGNLRSLPQDFKKMLSFSDPIFEMQTVENLAMIFDVMDDPNTVVERLKSLKRSMNEKRQVLIRQEAEQTEKLEKTGAILSEMSPEERQFLHETGQIKKYRPEERFTQSEILLRDALIIWRKQQADIDHKTVIEIFDNPTLDRIVNFKPQTLTALKMVPGFDEAKTEKYGEAIIAMIKHAPV